MNRYLNRSKKKYNLTASIVLEKSLHKLKTYLSFKTIKALLNFYLFDFFKTLASVNEQQLVESHIVQFYNRFATYNGSSPYQTSGIMTVIQHLESNFGTFVPFGGMINITKSLYDLAIRKGVKFNFNRSVEKILHNKKTVTGIKVEGLGDLNFDGVLNVIDIVTMVNGILGTGFTSEQLQVADLNQDGIVNVIDIVTLVNIILS